MSSYNNYEVNGTYGGDRNPCTVFVSRCAGGGSWYCANGSKNVNFTYEEIIEGVDIEGIEDHDTFTAGQPIESTEELEMELDL